MKEKVASLAAFNKFNLSDTELTDMTVFFNWYTAEAQLMQSCDTGDLPPQIYLVSMSNVFREDVAGKSISRERLLETAPEQMDGCFVVPTVLE